MPPSSNGGGCAAPGCTQNARAAVSLTKSIPPTPPHFERRQLRGVGNIEPNDEIGQRPAVLLLPSLVAIGSSWRGLDGRVLTSKRCDECDEQGIG